MQRLFRWILVTITCCASACATPANVREALAAKDEAYKQNAELMRQYAQLTESYDGRIRAWFVHIQTRTKLLAAVRWITSTPPPPPGVKADEWADGYAGLLGDEMLRKVNDLRFDGLPALGRFQAGQPNRDMTRLLQSIPTLARLATAKAEREWAQHGQPSETSCFELYVANVGSLRQLNRSVRAYLKIDIGPTDEDVRAIAAAITELSK